MPPKSKGSTVKKNMSSTKKRVRKKPPQKKRKSASRGRSKKRKSNIHSVKAVLLGLFLLVFSVFANNDFDLEATIDDFVNVTFLQSFFTSDEWVFSEDFYVHAEYLASLYPYGRDVYYLDVLTISPDDWMHEVMYIGGHDELGRTRPIIAHLSNRNLGSSESRGSQSHQPTGWSQNRHLVDGSEVWVKNRGHLIAYTLSFNFNELGEFAYGYLGSDDAPYNLFTQTAHSNQVIMTRYEEQIRRLLATGSNVVFKSAPIFRGDDLMARGIWLQAVSTCGELAFSVYIFNEQPGVIFDFSTGENWLVH